MIVTTAREQAREAAENVTTYVLDGRDAADAASDVWEPVLRELVEASDALNRGYVGEWWKSSDRYDAALARARAALGVNDG
jgi:hypothetical protein